MENKEKFAFRNVNMSQGVEVEFIKLLTSVETKSDDEIIKAFKEKISSDLVTCHADMLVRITDKIIFQTSKFNKRERVYNSWEMWVFIKTPSLESSSWTLNRFRI